MSKVYYQPYIDELSYRIKELEQEIEQLLEIYCLATDGDFNYFKNAMKNEKYDNDKTYEGPRCIYVDLKENMKPQFTEEQAKDFIKDAGLTHIGVTTFEFMKEAGYIIPVNNALYTYEVTND